MAENVRVSKHWKFNPNVKINEFNEKEITPDNLVNQILLLKRDDISSNLIMDLFGTFNGKNMCHHYDTFEVPAGGYQFQDNKGKLVSNTKPFITTFGIWFFNIFFLRDLNLAKVTNGYVNDNLTAKKFDNICQDMIYGLLENKIDNNDYMKFLDSTQFFMPLESILSPSYTEKMLACTKEINKLKKKLLAENKEAIEKGDAAVAQDIEKELLKFALEYLKDDPSLDAYLSGAGGDLDNNFKNMFIMKGAIRNSDPNAKQEFDIATSSFADGITSEEYSALSKSLVGGPYSRAKKTELGGYWEKLIVAAFSTITLDEPNSDCKSDKYIETILTEDKVTMFMYSYIIKPNGELEELNTETLHKYLNKKIKVRSTLFCKQFSSGKICSKCAGNFFYRRGGKNIGLSVSQIATVLKLKSMKQFHDSTVKMTMINIDKAFGN